MALAWVNAIGGLAGFAALFVVLLQTPKRKLVPDASLRPLLEALVEDFTSIVAFDGRPSEWFEDPDRRRRELTLASLQGAIVDK